jgi:hypothetical protein
MQPFRKPLGQVLIEMGAIDEAQLEQLLAFQRHDGGLLGEITVDRGLVSPLALVAALARQRREGRQQSLPQARPQTWKPLGKLLVDRRRITEVKLNQALAAQRSSGGFLGEILVERGWITPRDLVGALNEQLTKDSEHDSFYVREQLDGEMRTLCVASSFIAATDYVFEEVLVDREPERLDIVRGSGPGAEVLWDFAPVREQAPSAADLLQVLQALTTGTPTTAIERP